MNRTRSRIPSLDGLRAIAIGLVCLGHVTWNQSYLGRNGQYLKLGDIGVRIFFVLSGYLVTGILLRELESTSTISLRRFYFRRTLRIFPAFYAFVGIVATVNTLQWVHLYHGSAVPSLAYLTDYLVPGKRAFGPTWSLAVEEQFYLLWPAGLLLIGRRRALQLAGVILLICPLMRVVSFEFLSAQGGSLSQLQGMQFRFDTQADALAIGCLLCAFRARLHGRARYRRLLATRAFVLVPLAGLLVEIFGRQQLHLLYATYLIAGYALTDAAVALSFDWCLTYPSGFVGRLLNAPPVAAIGVLSYSIYLWQAPFLFVGRSAWWQVPPANLILTLLAATASYYLIESPFLRLRERWEPRLFLRKSMASTNGWTESGRENRRGLRAVGFGRTSGSGDHADLTRGRIASTVATWRR